MGICPLTQRMCSKLGHHWNALVCYEDVEIRNIKDMRVCPMQVTIEPRTDETTSNMPA
jgi:hypothetical protein